MYQARRSRLCSFFLAVVLVGACSPSTLSQQVVAKRTFVDSIFSAPFSVSGKSGSIAAPLVVGPSLTPNDPGYDPAWGNVLEIPALLGDLQQRIAAGTLNPQTVYVAVLDSAVMSHPDLDPSHATQYDHDFVGTPFDATLGSHATGIASIVAARTNNGMGAAAIAGFVGSIKFISVRIFDTNGDTTLQREIDGFNYISSLVAQGVPVVAVACAFGGAVAIDAERDAIKAVTDKGVVVFAGAGPKTNGGFYPASYSDTNQLVVPVSSLNSDGSGLGSDDWGGKAIAAPTNVKVVVKQSQPDLVSTFGGVSASTGQPAAAYALLRSVYPALSPIAALRRLGFSTLTLAGTSEGKLNPYLAATNQIFLVGSPIRSARAVALDALSQTAEPFSVRTRYFTTGYEVNEPAKLMLFAYNLNPATAVSTVSVRTTDLNDANGKSLVVESITAFPDMPFLASVTVLLRDDLAAAGDVRVRLTINGIETDPVLVKIK